jgi:hypothetical protein
MEISILGQENFVLFSGEISWVDNGDSPISKQGVFGSP